MRVRGRSLGRWAVRVAGAVFTVVIIGTLLLYRMDERTLWSVLPGVGSSETVREAGSSMVTAAERIDVSRKELQAATGMLMMGAVAQAANLADGGSPDDQILSRYVLALVKASLLQKQGDITALEYQMMKLPYKTGSTALMRRALPGVEKKLSLPENFMSGEYLEQEKDRESDAPAPDAVK